MTLTACFSMLLAASATLATTIATLVAALATLAPTLRRFATLLANFSHMLTILAYSFATLTPCFTRFLTGELMGVPTFVCGSPTFTGNLTLFFWVHYSKAAFLITAVVVTVRHNKTPPGSKEQR